jgi:hypothetical protein
VLGLGLGFRVHARARVSIIVRFSVKAQART